jgi:hypothetical protein
MFQYREGHWRILEFSSRQPLTGLHGTDSSAFETVYIRVSMQTVGAVKKLKSLMILKDQFKSIVSTKTVKFGYLKGLTTFKVSARDALSFGKSRIYLSSQIG